MTKLEQAKLLLDFYFAPWGAAKGAVWEDISGDKPFDEDYVTFFAVGILTGNRTLSEEDIKFMKIVTG